MEKEHRITGMKQWFRGIQVGTQGEKHLERIKYAISGALVVSDSNAK